jgi:hypothetical protein
MNIFAKHASIQALEANNGSVLSVGFIRHWGLLVRADDQRHIKAFRASDFRKEATLRIQSLLSLSGRLGSLVTILTLVLPTLSVNQCQSYDEYPSSATRLSLKIPCLGHGLRSGHRMFAHVVVYPLLYFKPYKVVPHEMCPIC